MLQRLGFVGSLDRPWTDHTGRTTHILPLLVSTDRRKARSPELTSHSCISARRRRKYGYQPYRGTGYVSTQYDKMVAKLISSDGRSDARLRATLPRHTTNSPTTPIRAITRTHRPPTVPVKVITATTSLIQNSNLLPRHTADIIEITHLRLHQGRHHRRTMA